MFSENPLINWTLWVYAKLGHFRKRQKCFFCFQKQFSYSADVKPTVNKTGLILPTPKATFDYTEHALSMCILRSLFTNRTAFTLVLMVNTNIPRSSKYYTLAYVNLPYCRSAFPTNVWLHLSLWFTIRSLCLSTSIFIE